MDTQVASRFCADAASLTLELGLYAAAAERKPEDSAAVSKVRIAAASILAACDAVSRIPPAIVPPPAPAPTKPAPTPASEQRAH